jgi:hypothetical protein
MGPGGTAPAPLPLPLLLLLLLHLLCAAAGPVVAPDQPWSSATAGGDSGIAATLSETNAALSGDPGFPSQSQPPSLDTAPFLLVHVPKCAGTLVRNVLYELLGPSDSSSSDVAPSALARGRLCIPGRWA